MKSVSFKIVLVFLLTTPFLFQGCGVWDNFTTYFNLYYNIKDIFNDAEKTITEQKKDIFSLAEPNMPTNLNQPINKVIEKCSNLLQFHPNSSFVDDALLIIGKSYYYQRNYLKALKKFQELLATRPDSKLTLTTRLWIGKTYNQLRKVDDAMKVLKDVRTEAIAKGDKKTEALTYVEEVKYAISVSKYTEAIILMKDLVKNTDFDEINAQALYKSGELYLLMNDYKNASASFLAVSEYSAPYDVEFNALIKYAKTERKLGNTQSALKMLLKMNNENKYYDWRDQIGLELGITYKTLQQYDDAYKQLYSVDTSFASSIQIGGVRYEMGEMFENALKNWDSAATYYAKAQTGTSTIEYTTLIRSKNLLFDKYVKLTTTNNNMLRQVYYFKNPDAFVKDSLAFYADSLGSLFNEKKLTDSTKILDSLKAKNINIDSLKRAEKQKRVQDSIAAAANNKNQPVKKETKTPPVMLRIPTDSLYKLVAKSHIDLGNLFFSEFNLQDSAFKYYKYTLDNYPETAFKSQLLFSLGSYYSVQGDSLKADSLFNYIYNNFKSDRIVNAAAQKLNKPKIDFDTDPGKDAFLRAETLMKSKAYNQALDSLILVYKRYPKSEYASKSLYTAGFLLENNLKLLDSAAHVYDTLLLKYPQTLYTRKAANKVNAYKQEIIRVAKAKQDSIKHVQDSLKHMQDSIKKVADSIKVADSLALVKKNIPIVKDSSKIATDSLKTDSTQVKTNTPLKPEQSKPIVQPEKKKEPIEEKKSYTPYEFYYYRNKYINRVAYS